MLKSFGETKEPQTVACGSTAEMVTSACGTEPHLDKLKEYQPECEAVQYKESNKKLALSAAEQEAVSSPVVIQGDTCDGLESANVHESDAYLSVVLPEVNQTNVTTTETEEHCTDLNNEPHDWSDLEGPIIKFLGDLDEVKNETKTTSTPEPQTSQKDQSSPNTSLSGHVDGDDMLFQEIVETRMDPKARDDHAERLTDTMLEHVQETCFSSEIQLQATEEPESLEPPAKKRLRRRMGMCGLGDRKRKFPFDEQHCRQGLIGRQTEEQAFKGNEVVKHLYNEFKSDGSTPVYNEGASGPACIEDEEVLKENMENNGATVMDDRKTEAEKENGYKTMNVSTDDSPKENTDVLKKDMLEEKHGTIIMNDKGTPEQVIFLNKLNLLEDISTGREQTLPSPTSGKNLIQDELSVSTTPNDHQMEITACEEEPNFPGTEMTNCGQGIVFNMKHEVLPDKQNHLGNDKVDEVPDGVAAEVDVTQEVSCSSICGRVEVSEGSVIVTKEIQTVPSGLEEREIETEEKHPHDLAATENHEPNRPDLSRSTEKGLDPLFVDINGILAVASTCENDKSVSAVSESVDQSGEDDKDISEPLAPSTGQEIHMHCFLDQNACDPSVTPIVAKQQVCNPTLTSASSELPQESNLSVPPLLYCMTDSQIHKIALSMELEEHPNPEDCDQQEDATELVCGLIRELSSLKYECRTVMVAHREMELFRRGKPPKAPNRHLCGPPHTEN